MISMNWNYIMILFNSSLFFCGGDVMCLCGNSQHFPIGQLVGVTASLQKEHTGKWGGGGEGGGYCVGSILLSSPLSPVYVAQEPVYRELKYRRF